MEDKCRASNFSRLWFALEKALPFVVLFACLTLVFLNYQLRSNNASLKQQLQSMQIEDAPIEGTIISALSGKTLDGLPNLIKFRAGSKGGLVLLAVFSPKCVYCTEMLPTWRYMASIIGANHVIFADASGTVDRQYIQTSNFPQSSDIILLNTEETLIHGFRGTPTTLILRDGKVIKSWAGVMSKSQIHSFDQALKAGQ